MSIDMKKTGENIRKIMEYSGMDAGDLAEICGFTTRNSVYAWFRGEAIPSIDNLVLLADTFGITIDEIIAR